VILYNRMETIRIGKVRVNVRNIKKNISVRGRKATILEVIRGGWLRVRLADGVLAKCRGSDCRFI
jgi:hypothetical protein